MDELIPIYEAAKCLGVSRSTIYRLMDSGQLPYVKIMRATRIPLNAIRELMEKNLRGPNGP